MNLIKINPADYGLEENKAKQISDMFKPMLDKMTELESEYNSVIKLEASNETCKKAKELRLKYVKVRTGTAQIHKELKAFYLQGGRFVDGWKNAQLMASQGIEEKLSDIKEHFEILERQRIVTLQIKRIKELKQYIEDGQMMSGELGNMTDEIWKNYIAGAKANCELRKEAEKKAEEEREKERKLKELEADRYYEAIEYKQFWSPPYDFKIMTTDEFNVLMETLKINKERYDKKQLEINLRMNVLKDKLKKKKNNELQTKK